MMANGWQTYKIGELLTQNFNGVTVEPDNSYKLLGVRLEGRGAFLREEKRGDNISAKTLNPVRAGDFIYSRLFAWRGAFGVVPDEMNGCFVSDEFPTFSINTEQLFPKFLQLYFARLLIWQEVEKFCTGTTKASRNRFKEPFFLAMEIPMPPLTEQRRIVERIEALAARVAEAQSLRREASEETELLLAAQLKNIRHKLLESNYPKKKIGEIAQVTSGGTPSRDNLAYWGGNIPWIKTGELIDGDIFNAEEHITQQGMENSSAKLFPPETILIALYGQGQTRGRTARLMIEATTNQACCAILPAPNILESRFTQYWQRSLYYEMREKSHGGAQPNWNGGMIKNIEIALPPLEEQRRLVAYLDGLQAQVSALRGLQGESARELSALMPSVLDKAFKGEL